MTVDAEVDGGGLLSAATVGGWLAAHGVPGTTAARELAGGVSNVVLAVTAGSRELVVKQSLPRLRVAEEWRAKRERALTEAAALQVAARVTPGRVPTVVAVDETACALAVERAPAGWTTWKDDLLAGRADPAVAAMLGDTLSRWHTGTAGDGQVAAAFGDLEALDQLRIDPYHRTVAARHPDCAPAIEGVITAMLGDRRCLVHGDFSPKNVLVGDGGCWVIDFEVAHYGDPAFDVAFLLCHLLLKSAHRPASAPAYRECAVAFCTAYRAGVAPERLVAHLGCLLLARADGKSPAGYLDAAAEDAVRRLGRRLLLDPPPAALDAWPLLEEALR